MPVLIPIHLGRTLGLAKPIERRFDLMHPDEGRMLLESTAVEQNLPMPGDISLLIYQPNGNPMNTWLSGVCTRECKSNGASAVAAAGPQRAPQR